MVRVVPVVVRVVPVVVRVVPVDGKGFFQWMVTVVPVDG